MRCMRKSIALATLALSIACGNGDPTGLPPGLQPGPQLGIVTVTQPVDVARVPLREGPTRFWDRSETHEC